MAGLYWAELSVIPHPAAAQKRMVTGMRMLLPGDRRWELALGRGACAVACVGGLQLLPGNQDAVQQLDSCACVAAR